MNSDWQTWTALLVVALAVAALVRSGFSRRKKPNCGCPPDKFKASLKR